CPLTQLAPVLAAVQAKICLPLASRPRYLGPKNVPSGKSTMMRSAFTLLCPCPLTGPDVMKLLPPRSVTLFRSDAITSRARHTRPGCETRTASSETSRPLLRSLPTFTSCVDEIAGCGTFTVSSRSLVFLTYYATLPEARFLSKPKSTAALTCAVCSHLRLG